MSHQEYTVEQRARFSEYAKSFGKRAASRAHRVPLSTIQSAVNRDVVQGSQQSLPRKGRKHTLEGTMERRARRFILSNRFLTAAEIADQLPSEIDHISSRTVTRIANAMGLTRCVAQSKPWLDERKVALRLTYACQYASFDWSQAIFTDEAQITLNYSSRTYVWRTPAEKGNIELCKPKMINRRAGIMYWAAIFLGGRSVLYEFDLSESEGKRGGVTAVIYRDQITNGPLRDVWTAMTMLGGSPTIVEDNPRIHTSNINRTRGGKHGFRYLMHPPTSPDLNPIENVWALLKRAISKRSPPPKTLSELRAAAQEEWTGIPQGTIDNVILSMPRRVEALKRSKGGPTKY